MLTFGDRKTNRRETGLDGGHACGGAGDILLLADAGVPPHLRETQRFPLVDQEAFGDGELLLQPSQLEVVAGNLGRNNHPDILERRLQPLSRRGCASHGGSHATEEVDLPERVEPGLIGCRAHRFFGEAGNRLLAAVDAGTHDGCRKPIEIDVLETCARLVDARHGDAYVMVGLQHVFLEAFQHRVVELVPPARVVDLRHEQRGIGVSQNDRSNLRRFIGGAQAAPNQAGGHHDERECGLPRAEPKGSRHRPSSVAACKCGCESPRERRDMRSTSDPTDA